MKSNVLEEEFSKKVALNKRIEAEISKLRSPETPENKEALELIRGLVALNESFKWQEDKFRQSCKEHMDELQMNIKKLTGADLDDDELGRIKEIEETYETECDLLNEARALAAKKSREITLVQRQIDEVPSRGELQQYQKQFIELYEQMRTKETETRKYIGTYNTLTDTRDFLQKEVSILNSIDSQYKLALKSEKNKELLRDSLVKITAGVNESLAKVEAKLKVEKQKKDGLNAEYLKGLEEEREYYALTKDFAEQCIRNQKLLEALGT